MSVLKRILTRKWPELHEVLPYVPKKCYTCENIVVLKEGMHCRPCDRHINYEVLRRESFRNGPSAWEVVNVEC